MKLHVTCQECYLLMAAIQFEYKREIEGAIMETCCFCGALTDDGIYIGSAVFPPEMKCRRGSELKSHG